VTLKLTNVFPPFGRSTVRSSTQVVRHPVTIFQHASKPTAEYREWDPRYAEVVTALLSDLGPPPAGTAIEHVGSTAIPGCGGKGIIDLLALFPHDGLKETKTWLLSQGLSPQGPEFSRTWPESRPMYLAQYLFRGHPFLIYVHVVRRDSDEVRRFRQFRDLLRGRPELIAEYSSLKKQILAMGVRDTDEYAVQKRPFMRKALGAGHALKDEDV
jgi:GrpB-like predicted nucleotidyltransferase (UPF0157 family)